MSDLTKPEREAIDAVAKRFSGTWQEDRGAADAYIIANGKRVAVDVAPLKRRGARAGDAGKPHLRFDKVVREVMGRLQSALADAVPDGTTVLLTITAPIRLASKITADIEEKMRTLLRRGSASRDMKQTIHGNRVVTRILRGGSQPAPKLIGFVHNPETDPLLLLDPTAQMLEVVGAVASGRATRPERWLVVITGRGISWLETYRYIYSQVSTQSRFKKVVMTFDGGSVEELTK